jgi:hypothetical protein
VTFTKVYSGEIAGASTFNASLSSVPGQSGHLFFTSGQQDGTNPGGSKFMRSRDGGTTWSEVAGMQEVYAFGFGAAASGQSYPAIFVAGYLNNRWGLWRSDDNAANWVSLGDTPLDMADQVTAISGDANVYGRIYVGFGGSGAIYGGFRSS